MDSVVFIDWSTEWEKWENYGRSALESNCKHHDQEGATKDCPNMQYSGWCEKCGEGEDSSMPMMNYSYPLFGEPSEEEILKVVKRTCLTVMYNNDTDKWVLALCGGGMDLSQSIALAYILVGDRIPNDLAQEVCLQPALSVSKADWVMVMKECRRILSHESANALSRIEEIDKRLKEDGTA